MRRAFADRLRGFSRGQSGGVLVEFAMVIPLFLLLFFGLIDFARIGFSYVMANKATERAVRIAVVRGSACGPLAVANQRGDVNSQTENVGFGQSCSTASGLCFPVETVTCTGSAANDTATEIWAEIAAMMPNNATIENLQFSYTFDDQLGYLGGPYTPVVSVDVVDLTFEFVSPLGALAVLAGSAGSANLGEDLVFPSMSASLPAEDLQQGESS